MDLRGESPTSSGSPIDPHDPVVMPDDWQAFAGIQANGRVLRRAPTMAGPAIDLWAPDGGCEEMLIQQQAVEVRKRQEDNRCRVVGCEREAPKAPFLCDYHSSGELYSVAVMDLERGASRWINIKLCQRLPKHWDYLRNFTRKKNGKFNLTCQQCCVKASSYIPKRASKKAVPAKTPRPTTSPSPRPAKRTRGGAQASPGAHAAAGATSSLGSAAADVFVGGVDGTGDAMLDGVALLGALDVPPERTRVEVLLQHCPIGHINVLPSTTLRQCRDSLLPRLARPPMQAYLFLNRGSPVNPEQEALCLAADCLDESMGVTQLQLTLASSQRRRMGSYGASSVASPYQFSGSDHQFGDAFVDTLLSTTGSMLPVDGLPTLGGFGAIDTSPNTWSAPPTAAPAPSSDPFPFLATTIVPGATTASAVASNSNTRRDSVASSRAASASMSIGAGSSGMPAGLGGGTRDGTVALGHRHNAAVSQGAMHALTPDDCPDGFLFPAGNDCESVLVSKGVLRKVAAGDRCRVNGCEHTPALPGTAMCAYHSQNAMFMVETLDDRGNFVRCFARLCRVSNVWEWASQFHTATACVAHSSEAPNTSDARTVQAANDGAADGSGAVAE